MKNNQRDYRFIDSTISLCPECLKRVDAKIILRSGSVYLQKYCKQHGHQEVLLEEDGDYYLKRGDYDKPGSISKPQTEINKGCPFDCGLCPDHEQHTCNGLIEVTDACDLNCKFCYANSGKPKFLTLKKIGEMMDLFLNSEFGNAEILQISGGEPTLHPQIIEIIKMAREKGIKYVLLNTNGLRIASDENFVKELSQFVGRFEIYLQFDSFDDKTYQSFRGKKLWDIKKKAIENLTKYKIPVTLVATIKKGVNDHEIGKIIKFGLDTKCIRGVNFQPIAYFGRMGGLDKDKDRIKITGIIKCIEKQMKGMIKKDDFIPLPCDVDRVAITYLYRLKDEFIPIIRNINAKEYLPMIRNTFKFDPEDILKDIAGNVFCNSGECCDYMKLFGKLKPLIPPKFLKSQKEKIEYVSENTFRVSIVSFVDAYNFDMKSMKKECVHIITPDLKKIPFSAYNMIHRK
jgi:uncharacterized radical SAM superfamily Fe-S cluster-containing enzyme